jgi:hypothetical protein
MLQHLSVHHTARKRKNPAPLFLLRLARYFQVA